MKKKVTLSAVGEFCRENFSYTTGWVTLDMAGIRVFDNKGGKESPPAYDSDKHLWLGGANNLMLTILLKPQRVSVRDYCREDQIEYSKCIECVDPALMPEVTERRKRATKHKKGVLAYFADGTTLRFDSKCEARNFFGLKRAEEVTKYIESGHPLPDGTTTLDEALPDVDIQSGRDAKK